VPVQTPQTLATRGPRVGRRRRRVRRRLAVPAPGQRHLLNRFSYGVTPELVRDMRRAGGAERWFLQQLAPQRIDDRAAAPLRDWFPYLDLTPLQ
jgi:hypothetical protein